MLRPICSAIPIGYRLFSFSLLPLQNCTGVWLRRYGPGWLESASLFPCDSQPSYGRRFSFWAFCAEVIEITLPANK